MPRPSQPSATLTPLALVLSSLATALLPVAPGTGARSVPVVSTAAPAPVPPASDRAPAPLTPLPAPVDSRERFPTRFTAPYVEAWGSPDVLERAHRELGLSYFTLGFVISDGGCEGALDGTIPIAEPGWPESVAGLRAAGGDVIVSLGGGAGTELARACSSVDALVGAYRRVVEAFDLRRIDLDIEGPTLEDDAANERRTRALARLQREYAAEGRRLAVHYTLPTHPHGLSDPALRLLFDARDRGLEIDLVNIMTMDYGPDFDMGRTAIGAAKGLHEQLAGIWPGKSAAQLWAMEGNTPMVGVNDAVNEVFSTADAIELAAFADETGIRILSYWSLGRDRACPVPGVLAEDCSGTAQEAGDFARLLNRTASPAPRIAEPARFRYRSAVAGRGIVPFRPDGRARTEIERDPAGWGQSPAFQRRYAGPHVGPHAKGPGGPQR
ncbi:chitinase [Kitasatospora sp. NPDC091207]|uniref:chitinase n=1 Tax=Kitasatospora sp. NPDC091207 TaxID=3364083 RepID=UPI0037FACBD1